MLHVIRQGAHLPAFRNLSLLTLVLLSGCIGVSGHATTQGKEESEVVLAVPLDRPYAFSSRRPETLEPFLRGQVLSVHNGESITVMVEGRSERIFLIGIRAPDLDETPLGLEAREALRTLVGGKMVRLEFDTMVRDPKKRLFAYVYAGETLVNVEMIRQGMAVLSAVPQNLAYPEEYQRAQAEAREAGRGIWNQGNPGAVRSDNDRRRP